jgi:hypothetical protein
MGRWKQWFQDHRRRHEKPAPQAPAGLFKSVSRTADLGGHDAHFGGYVGLPGDTPFAMLQVYRFLRDSIPDISDAIWTWKRLCQTGWTVDVEQASSDAATARARRLIAALDARVNSGDRGMEGLLDIFYTSLFTYGAAAVEIVLSQSRESVYDVVPIDVWTVRFTREGGRLQAWQVLDGQSIKLPMDRFIYVGMDREGTNPYGRSMLRSIPFVVKIQQRLIEDMAKATHNAGWSKLHVQYAGEDRARGESIEAFQERMRANLNSLRDKLAGIEADQNLVTYDNVKISLLRGDQHAQVFYDNHKAIEEQVITGMHLMPILLGRNYGTTETYGTAQFEIINRQVEGVNRSVQILLERLYNFELALMWGEASAKVTMRTNRTVDILKEAQAREKEIGNVLRLKEAGLLDDDQVKAALSR